MRWPTCGRARRGVAEADGFSQPYVRAVAYGSAFYGFLAVLLSIRAARVASFAVRVRRSGSGLDATFWAASRCGSGRRCSSTCTSRRRSRMRARRCGGAVRQVWLHVRRTWSAGGVFALGLCAALLAMVREQDVFVALGPAVDFCARRRFSADARLRGLRGCRLPSAGVARLCARLPAATPRLQRAERLPRARVARGAKDVLVRAARAAGAALTAPRLLLLDAARRARDRRT